MCISVSRGVPECILGVKIVIFCYTFTGSTMFGYVGYVVALGVLTMFGYVGYVVALGVLTMFGYVGYVVISMC